MFKKIKLNLFWFLRPGAQLDLDDLATRQTYAQQVLSRGREADVKELIKDIGLEGLRAEFERMKRKVGSFRARGLVGEGFSYVL